MALTPGTHVGPYEIVGLLGAGGMGEVYRARDTKLDREVAIKVLPEMVVADPERVARFQREARTLAALNHPHIGGIYGLEDGDGVRALVLELVEGPTLADRIAQGPISLDEALPIAKQIAEALEAAHEQGIIHRDLKPANIKVRPDGTVKVLDFGLAKALDQRSASLPAEGVPNPTLSPTITTPALLTGHGVILGTVAYMAPEQARGATLDRRVDLWAFGAIVYEMLCGRKPFAGHTISDTVAAVLKDEPDWKALPADTPASARRLIQRCLRKDARRRTDSAGAARLDIEEAIDREKPDVAIVSQTRSATAGTRWRPLAFLILGGLVGVGGSWWVNARSPKRLDPVTYVVGAPSGFLLTGVPGLTMSRDGRSLVFIARNPATSGAVNGGLAGSLFLRTTSDPTAHAIRGAEPAAWPFISPDGRWVGYFDDAAGTLMKVPIEGGTPIKIGQTASLTGAAVFGADWGLDGRIVFARRMPTSSNLLELVQLAATGGTPAPVLSPDAQAGETGFGWPQWLPDGDHVLVTVKRQNWQRAAIAVVSVRDRSKRIVVENASFGRIVPTGHLLFVREGNLMGVAFDSSRIEARGEPVLLQAGIGYEPGRGYAEFAVGSDTGTSALVIRGADNDASDTYRARLVWVDRQGHETETSAAPHAFRQFRLSSDGQRVVMDIDAQNRDLWVYDFRRDVLSRLTTTEVENETPLWSPDGRSVAWAGTRDGKRHLLIKSADGSDLERRVWSLEEHFHLCSWSPDGRSILVNVIRGNHFDLEEVALEPSIQTKRFLESKSNRYGAAISPDGQRVAFVSDESGQTEVYLTSRRGEGKVQVSARGGAEPIWSRDGRELFFRSSSRIMRALVSRGTSLEVEDVQPLFDAPFALGGGRDPGYAISPDGQRFLMLRRVTSDVEIVVTLNWFEYLKARIPVR